MPVKTEYVESLIETTPVSVYIAIICVAFVCTLLALKIKGIKDGVKISSIVLLFLYVTIVLGTTVLFRPEGSEREIKYIPFWSYMAISEGKSRLIDENIMNVAAFLPIGLLLAIGVDNIKLWQAVVVGCTFSICIELMQFYFDRGQCEIDDVIHNTLGCILGFCIARTVRNTIRQHL